MELETINKLYLELSQIATAKTEREMRLEDALKMAYCQKIGSDSPTGLDCCDDYRDWLAALTPNAGIEAPNAKLTGAGGFIACVRVERRVMQLAKIIEKRHF